MLKLKSGKEMILLEKFGFTPKYNEDTGKIDRYVYKIKSIDKVGIIVKDEVIEITETYSEVLEVLYDLIKAGIITNFAYGNLISEILKLINNYAEENQTDYTKTMIKVITSLEELVQRGINE